MNTNASHYERYPHPTTHLAHPLISEAVRKAFREILAPKPLEKGDGAYEIGVEANKRNIKESLEALLGQTL